MTFSSFKFHTKIIQGISACGYTLPTPIQKESIPQILKGKDLFGLAQTGTGKTAAFVLPILQRLINGPRKRQRTLIIAPTRELVIQIAKDGRKLGGFSPLKIAAVFGGADYKKQEEMV